MMDSASLQRNAATQSEGLVAGTGLQASASKGVAIKLMLLKLKVQHKAKPQWLKIGSMVSGIAGGFGARSSGGSDIVTLIHLRQQAVRCH